MTSLAEKTALFSCLDSFGSDDEFDEKELAERRRWRGFFDAKPVTPSSVVAAAAAAAAAAAHEEPVVLDLTQEQPPKSNPKPKRVVAEPTPTSNSRMRVIKGTPITSFPQKSRVGTLTNASDPDITIVEDTPIPDSTRPAHRGVSSIIATPKVLSTLLGGDSPSPSMAIKKRKRESALKLRPESQQIFKGLAFFYIPDNDISPVRRMRITKAREYGATWTRLPHAATHIIVDKGLTFKDIEGTLQGTNKANPPEVVSETYPLDCIQYRTILNPDQRMYKLKGQPQPVGGKANAAHAAPPASGRSATPLQIKPPQRNPKRWDYVPPEGTPERSQESPPPSRVAATPTPTDSQPVILNIEGLLSSPKDAPDDCEASIKQTDKGTPANKNTQGDDLAQAANIRGTKGKGKGRADELTEYITIMQEYKDLPLDAEDDDTHYEAGAGEGELEMEASGSEDERANKRKRAQRKTRSGRKDVAFEDRFACNSAGTKDAKAGNPNARTIEVLQQMANYYDRVNDNWRTIAYRKVIATLKRQDTRITTEEQAFQLPSIGQRLAQKIEEIVTTDRLKRLEYTKNDPMDEALQLFLGIYGVGTTQAQQWIAQGHRTLDDLKAKAKPTTNQLIGIEHYDDLNTRIPRREVEALGQVVKRTAQLVDPTVELIIAGSYRRGAESSGDIDFMVTKPNTESPMDLRSFLDELVRRLEADKFLVARLASSRTSSQDGSKWHGCCVLPRIRGFNEENYRPVWRRIDFLLVPESEIGAALLYFTGNDIFNRSMRLLASKKGMRLNQRGLYKNVMRGPQRVKVTEGELMEGRDEKKIFEILGVQWREPHERWC